jgi:predicted DNA-binding transcriptional regulator YafY
MIREMRATRLVSLLLLLQTRGQLTAGEIAERLEVSSRTVHRDVQSLAAAGVPVEAVRGVAGGYRLAGGYRTRLTGLTADEAEALFAAGIPGPAAELGLGGELAAARLKLLAALPQDLQERASRASALFHLDTRGWFRAEDKVPHLPALSSAVWSGCRARIRYREAGKVVQRTIDPLGLVLKGGVWYLVARRSAGMRVYRVSRVAAVHALADSFERPDAFELREFWEEWSRDFEQRLARVEVVVRVNEDVRRYLPGEPRVEPDGRAVLAFSHLGDAYRELLRFGAQLEVLEPAELRTRLADTGREIAQLYAAA